MRDECKTCVYWDGYLGLCQYAEKEGTTRLSLHNGNVEEMQNAPCGEWKKQKRSRVPRRKK